jgi:alanine transaminase
MTLKVDPPSLERGESKETVEQFQAEYNEIFDALKERALLLTHELNKMENVSCNSVQGAMYAFPQFKFSDKVIAEA